MRVRVCVCACARACARVRACVRVRVRVCVTGGACGGGPAGGVPGQAGGEPAGRPDAVRRRLGPCAPAALGPPGPQRLLTRPALPPIDPARPAPAAAGGLGSGRRPACPARGRLGRPWGRSVTDVSLNASCGVETRTRRLGPWLGSVARRLGCLDSDGWSRRWPYLTPWPAYMEFAWSLGCRASAASGSG
jgi:hypothetical protein